MQQDYQGTTVLGQEAITVSLRPVTEMHPHIVIHRITGTFPTGGMLITKLCGASTNG